jgi:hypothetical protein
MEEAVQLPVCEERVELSGWDYSGKFFLETSYLIGSAEGEIFAEVKQKIRLGAPIFVRRLGWKAISGDVPAVYQIKAVESRGSNGSGCVRLRLLKPIRSFPVVEDSGNHREDLEH